MDIEHDFVVLHAWVWLDDDNNLSSDTGKDRSTQAHYDYWQDYGSSPDGWSVYRRISNTNDPVEPFSIIDERDFDTYQSASEFAQELAVKHSVEWYED